MAVMAKNPFEATWKKEEKHYGKLLSDEMTAYLRSQPIQKKLDAKFKTSNSVEMLDWSTKNISEATRLLQKECDSKLAKVMKGYPGMIASASISMEMVRAKFLPRVTVNAVYTRVLCGGQKHQRAEKETLRDLSMKYYGSEIYWQTIEHFNIRQTLFGQTLDIPKMYVPENHANTGVKPKSGGTIKPSKMLMPEFNYAAEKVIDSVHTTVYPHGAPFMIHLTYQATGSMNVARKGDLPLKFDLKEYTVSAEKACSGINFEVKGQSKKDSDLLTLNISGAGGRWAIKIAMVDGHTFKISAPPSSVKYTKDGYTIVGKIGISLEGKLSPTGGGLRIGVGEAPPWYTMPFVFVAGAALFLMTRGGLNPATSGLLINSGGTGTVPYDAGGVV